MGGEKVNNSPQRRQNKTTVRSSPPGYNLICDPVAARSGRTLKLRSFPGSVEEVPRTRSTNHRCLLWPLRLPLPSHLMLRISVCRLVRLLTTYKVAVLNVSVHRKLCFDALSSTTWMGSNK